MRIPRALRIVGLALLGLLLLAGICAASLWIYFHPKVERTTGVIYGERHGKKLTLDILRAGRTNGLGVVLLLSGGWRSPSPGSFDPWMAAPLLRRGYTVFPVYHVSQPEATVMEIAEDMNRAVRHIRYHAREYGIDPNRLGVTGGSAGGHLSLLLATKGGPGPADSDDPVARESSAVQAVAVFYPATDLLNLGASVENPGDGGPPKSYVRAFGADSTNLAVWKVTGRDMSPIYHVTSNLPPILIIHGDADVLIPLDQSIRFRDRARECGREFRLIVHKGGQHGWLTMIWDIRKFADWFDRYLKPGTSHHLEGTFRRNVPSFRELLDDA